MIVERHRLFLKNYRNRIIPYPTIDRRFEERLRLLLQDPKNPILKDHGLTGKKRTFRAFSITGDIRVIYRIEGEVIRLYDIGNHNQVY